jgi:23S rRNA pseudouridine1911/1915/1917 synthase
LIKLGRVCARPELFANGRYDLKDYFEVVYEDELIVLVDKWAGAHSVTLSLEDSPTLADALAAYCPACAEASPDNREAGLVQRLDRPTRGLLLAAKNRNAWAALRRQFAEKIVDKTYLALVEGIVPWDEQELRGDLVARAERMWVEPGDTAAGEVSVVWRSKSKGSSLVRLRSNKGQRHQVRAHLAHLGFPLLGDSLYGSKLSFQAAEHGISQESDFFLLASELAFQHPETGKRLAFYTKQEAPTATK